MDRSRTRPPYPTLSPSNTSSVYSSSSSLSSMPSPGQSVQDQHSAPLPSPTTEQRQYFGSLNSPSAQQQQQTRYFTRSSNQTQQQMQMPSSSSQQASSSQQQTASASLEQHSQQRQTSLSYMPDRQGAGTTNAQTMAMLADYNLIAEAAKRAQVACIIRDLDEMDMS